MVGTDSLTPYTTSGAKLEKEGGKGGEGKEMMKKNFSLSSSSL
jgi:hypothetical protein